MSGSTIAAGDVLKREQGDSMNARKEDPTVSITYSELLLLFSFIPEWARVVPRGLDPTFYGTLSYEGDLAVKSQVDALADRLNELSPKEKI